MTALAVAVIGLIIGLGVGYFSARLHDRTEIDRLESELSLVSLSETRSYLMSLLSWAVRRKRGEPAGGFPDAAKYPRFDLALVGSLPAIEQVTEALATLAEIADGAGVDVETRLRLSGISRRMSAALSEQESLLGLHRPLNRIPPYEAASLSAQFGVVIRQLDPASSGPTAAMVA